MRKTYSPSTLPPPPSPGPPCARQSFPSKLWAGGRLGTDTLVLIHCCLQVINGSSSTSAGFDATWYWPVDADTVHSFPHVTFSSNVLPIPLEDISALRLTALWAMSAGTISTAQGPLARIGVDSSGLSNVATKANVAFDLFLDHDGEKSTSALDAGYEIMVWIGRVGQPYPLGYDSNNAVCYTQQLGSLNL